MAEPFLNLTRSATYNAWAGLHPAFAIVPGPALSSVESPW